MFSIGCRVSLVRGGTPTVESELRLQVEVAIALSELHRQPIDFLFVEFGSFDAIAHFLSSQPSRLKLFMIRVWSGTIERFYDS